jgi:uncharacterized protein
MKIDISALLSGRAQKLDFEYPLSPEDEFCALPEDIRLTAPINVRGSVRDQNGVMTLDAHVRAEYEAECARCLDTVEDCVEFDFTRLVTENAPDDGEDEDIVSISEGGVNVDAQIIEELSLEFPSIHLCREDCPGLCPTCGKRLADGDCGCREKKEIDPRLKVLQKLLENPDQV